MLRHGSSFFPTMALTEKVPAGQPGFIRLFYKNDVRFLKLF